MSRILAIDYGKKRTGIAVSDTLQMIANGLTTVPTHELLAFILDYVGKEPVERILVGLPKQMNNEASENMKRIEPFVRLLKKKLPEMPVEYVDERFTSVLAHRTMREAGLKKKDRQNDFTHLCIRSARIEKSGGRYCSRLSKFERVNCEYVRNDG